jgi:hypothetical protein
MQGKPDGPEIDPGVVARLVTELTTERHHTEAERLGPAVLAHLGALVGASEEDLRSYLFTPDPQLAGRTPADIARIHGFDALDHLIDQTEFEIDQTEFEQP